MPYKQSVKNQILLWLFVVGFLIICTTIFGGYTRLTGSGLSITEWKPVVGIVPPLNDYDWNIEFEKYKNFPEYTNINFDMNLAQFKIIFLIEYIHRVLARAIFLAFIIPWLYFVFCKKIKNDIYFFILFLGIALQGFIGWYMVQSGLSSKPEVSHFRLAIHFFLAILIYKLVVFRFLYYKHYFGKREVFFRFITSQRFLFLYFVFYGLFILQIIWGCFVAGLKAGLIYNSYPLMGNSVLPSEINCSSFRVSDLFSNVVYVQFIHRILAIFVLIFSFLLFFYSRFFLNDVKLKIVSLLLFIGTIIQFFLGVLTLLFHVAVVLAVFHQLGAFVISSLIIYIFFLIRKF